MPVSATFQHNGQTLGKLEVKSVSGRKAIVGATMVLNCELSLTPTQEGWTVIDALEGYVSASPAAAAPSDLGPIWSMHSFQCISSPSGDSTSLAACLALPPLMITAIDTMRAQASANQLPLVFWLRVLGARHSGRVNASVVATWELAASDWFRVLKEAQYEARHVIDVPIEGGRVAGALHVAAEHYRRAIDQRNKRSYVQVVAECRKVLEATRDVLALTPKSVAEWNAQDKKGWSIRECIEYSRAAIHQICHHAAHPGVSDDPSVHEADLILSLTGSLLRFYAQ